MADGTVQTGALRASDPRSVAQAASLEEAIAELHDMLALAESVASGMSGQDDPVVGGLVALVKTMKGKAFEACDVTSYVSEFVAAQAGKRPASDATVPNGAAPAAALKSTLADALAQQSAILHLLRAWDVDAEPHDLHAQFTAVETCAKRAETLLCKALDDPDLFAKPSTGGQQRDDDYARIDPRRRQIGKEASYQLDSVLGALIRDIHEQNVDGTDLARALAIRAKELNLIASAVLMERGDPQEADAWHEVIFGMAPEQQQDETDEENDHA